MDSENGRKCLRGDCVPCCLEKRQKSILRKEMAVQSNKKERGETKEKRKVNVFYIQRDTQVRQLSIDLNTVLRHVLQTTVSASEHEVAVLQARFGQALHETADADLLSMLIINDMVDLVCCDVLIMDAPE